MVFCFGGKNLTKKPFFIIYNRCMKRYEHYMKQQKKAKENKEKDSKRLERTWVISWSLQATARRRAGARQRGSAVARRLGKEQGPAVQGVGEERLGLGSLV